MKQLAAVVLSLLLCGVANAQDRIKTFKMFVPVTEQFVGCLYEADAVAIIKALAVGNPAVGEAKMRADLCRIVQWTITYDKLMHNQVGKDGEHLTVYRGKVSGKDIFVPMVGWTHEVI